jgi:type IV secretion system protein VirB8
MDAAAQSHLPTDDGLAMNDALPPPDDWHALPVERERLAAHFAAVEDWRREQVQRSRSSERRAWLITYAALAMSLALAVTVAGMRPLQRLVPMIVALRSDGTFDTALAISDLPPTQQEAVIRSALWQYVRARESYARPEAHYRYTLVSMMSAPAVQQAYQRWFWADTNPQSPQNMVGKAGQIDVALLAMTFIRPTVAEIHFRRTVLLGGDRHATTWMADVGFALTDRLAARDRILDPGGVIVTQYSSSQDTPQ